MDVDANAEHGEMPKRRRYRPASRTAQASRLGRPRGSRNRPKDERQRPPGRPGRKPGSLNRATSDVRAAFTLLVENNAPKMQRWLDRVATTDPGRALDVIAKLSDFVIPRLSRTEVRPIAPVLPEGDVATADAAAIYARIVGEPGIDLTRLRFARPPIEHVPPSGTNEGERA